MIGFDFLSHLFGLSVVLGLLLALFFGTFLYWRAGKRELIENKVIFDTVSVFLFGGFIFGRAVDFVVRADYYEWSIKKLIFFNVFWGLDGYGALLGGLFLVFLYTLKRRENFWEIFDLAAGGIAFAIFIFLVLRSLGFIPDGREPFYLQLLFAFCFLSIFWIIKRLERQKRHKGFFASLFLTTFSIVNIVFIAGGSRFSLTGYLFRWDFAVNCAILIVSAIVWYVLAKRKVVSDIKGIFGAILLATFKVKRVLTTVREADNSARMIVLSPAYVARALYYLVKYIGREVHLSFMDLMRAFGVK